MKISVILPTNKISTKEEVDKILKVAENVYKHTIIDEDFTNLCKWYVIPSDEDQTNHILQPTLSCLLNQTFKDFEVILCHKHPEDAENLVHNYKRFMNITLIEEKPSIWHGLGEFPTVNNNRNTGIMASKGELLVFLDDMTIFGEDLLQNIWDEYKNNGNYVTSQAIRRIRYKPNMEFIDKDNRKVIYENDIYGSRNLIGSKQGDRLSNASTWTYCCSVSREDVLDINGFDELYDGNMGGTDQDFGRRLDMISSHQRIMKGIIYEFAHKSHKHLLRDDEMFRVITKQSPQPTHIKANMWKPTEREMRLYKRWYVRKNGDINPLWDKLIDVPLFNMKDKE